MVSVSGIVNCISAAAIRRCNQRMAKVKVYRKIYAAMLVMACFPGLANAQYRLQVRGADRDRAFLYDTLKLKQEFPGRASCETYVNELAASLQNKGYLAASVDSVYYDSVSADCLLYVGQAARHIYINTDSVDPLILQQTGVLGKKNASSFNILKFRPIQEKILDYLENNGYPFASVKLDSMQFVSDSVYAFLKIDMGPAYKIDSIRNYGNAVISSSFLQQYLGILNGSLYQKEKLRDISRKLSELPFLQEKQPWDLTMLGAGSVLNVYLDPRKSSEVNVLLGLLPSSNQQLNNKLLVTGEANINLKNALGNGESIGLNWQQIQARSPRLNILFNQPYLFGSPFGMNFNFDLFKKDSSFVNISILLGASYSVSSRQTGSVFIQRLASNLLSVDTLRVKNTRRLPDEADIRSVNLGVNYDFFNTDYRFNPRRGSELTVSASAGTKTIRKNNAIVKLSDHSDPEFDFNRLYDTLKLNAYQFRVKVKAVHYFPLTRASAIKAALNGGWFQSPSIFRNELFQIGGYKLLRGFDEESIFASRYAVATVEYRYLLGRNSFLFGFVDGGVAANRLDQSAANHQFLGAGLGMAFETKAGIFNISYAAGKRDDQSFNLRSSKIHLGYINYF